MDQQVLTKAFLEPRVKAATNVSPLPQVPLFLLQLPSVLYPVTPRNLSRNTSTVVILLLGHIVCICSTQSENLCNLEIALRILKIPRLCTIVARSRDCTIHLR